MKKKKLDTKKILEELTKEPEKVWRVEGQEEYFESIRN